MIRSGLNGANIPARKFTIVKIPDIHNDEEWVSHLERLIPQFGEVYSGTSLARKLFERDGKHKIITPKFNINISGTEIRRLMEANKPWKEFVPKAVAGMLGPTTCHGEPVSSQ